MPTIVHRMVTATLLAFVACASVYQPTASIPEMDAKLLIRHALEEQPPGFGANAIEITDEKLSFVRAESRHFGPIPTASYTETTTFYFKSFGSVKIGRKKRKGLVVWVFDQVGTPRFRVVVPTEDAAKRFADALYGLSLNAGFAPAPR